MTKRKRRAVIWLASIFAAIAVAAAVFVSTLDRDKAKEYISAGVSKATGRQLSINGDLEVHLGWISRVRASQIQFENAQWSTHRQMVEVGLVDVQIDLWQLLKRRLVFPIVNISQVKVVLEKKADGAANWEFRAAPVATEPVPEKRTQFPIIEKLIIKDGTLLFDNQETNNRLELKLTEAEAAGFLEEPVKLKAEGYLSETADDFVVGGRFLPKPEKFQGALPSATRPQRRKNQSKNQRQRNRPIGDERGRRHA